jgi:hypothetical protein
VRKALVTIALGDMFLRRWKAVCEARWRKYCERHGYDLIVFDRPLDTSVRAQNRSPAWQKCLVPAQDAVQKYEQIAWVDADIIINPNSPGIFDIVPLDRIGVTDENAYPSLEEHQKIVQQLVCLWERQNIEVAKNWQIFLDIPLWHSLAGCPKRGNYIIQTGVMALSPKYHRDLYLHVYNNYEDKGTVIMNYEMRPLSYEIQANGLEYFIDKRFNAIVYLKMLSKSLLQQQSCNTAQELIEFIAEQYKENYFLHFAGRPDYMEVSADLFVNSSPRSLPI